MMFKSIAIFTSKLKVFSLSDSFAWPIAAGLIASPLWLHALEQVSTVAALLLPPLGVALALLKIIAHLRGSKISGE